MGRDSLTPRARLVRAALTFAACGLAPLAARAQQTDPADAQITHTAGEIRLDGTLAEPAWRTADSITDFRQREPTEGRSGTERTVVRRLATPSGLYVGVWAYDSAPGAIRHA